MLRREESEGYEVTLDDLMKENAAGLLLEVQRECVRATQENALLRKLLWLRHDADHAAGLYGDDGEMQCGQCLIDFKRLPAEDIDRAWQDAGKQKLINAIGVPPAAARPDALVLATLLRRAYAIGGWEITVDHPRLAAEINEALKRFP